MNLFSWFSRLFCSTSKPAVVNNSSSKPTTFTVEDETYPIEETRNGRFYIIRTSKNGVLYRWPIPEKYLEEFNQGIRTHINKTV